MADHKKMATNKSDKMNSGENSNEQVEVEYKVPMHCNACERRVAKAINKLKGVETFMTDMTEDRVVVIGRINPEKVLKKLRKKIGKKVELVVNEDQDAEEGTGSWQDHYYGEGEAHLMFNDENANSCTIM